MFRCRSLCCQAVGGGVIEHPEASHAWSEFGLVKPPHVGGWIKAGDGIGWTVCVEQGHYGHMARKKTWLYVVGCSYDDLPALMCGSSGDKQKIDPYHARVTGGSLERMSKIERVSTPVPFRDVLIRIAQRTRMKKGIYKWQHQPA